MAARKPRVVVTIHGIQTSGRWQKKITPHLARHGLIPYHIEYGYFDVIRFLLPWTREAKIRAIREELQDLIYSTGVDRVSVIAHSFGTMLAAHALVRDNGVLKFDRLILTGSILPLNFDWAAVLGKKWLLALRNERAEEDDVVSLASFVSLKFGKLLRLNAGASGKHPFSIKSPFLVDESIFGGHSSTHNPMKFEIWARFLAYPMLPSDLLGNVHAHLQSFRQSAAIIVGKTPKHIRANLFVPVSGVLRILPGATDNMTYVPELDVQILPGHGATGNAYTTRNPCLLLKLGKSWQGSSLPGEELAKIDPSLRWVLSLPVISPARDVVIAVITIDGLCDIPAILREDTKDRKALMLGFKMSMPGDLLPALEAAFKGEKLMQAEV